MLPRIEAVWKPRPSIVLRSVEACTVEISPSQIGVLKVSIMAHVVVPEVHQSQVCTLQNRFAQVTPRLFGPIQIDVPQIRSKK